MTPEEIKQHLTTKFKVTLDSFGGDQLRAAIFLDRYSKRDKDNVPVELTYFDTVQRLANSVMSEQITHSKVIGLLNDFRFVPGGRILAGPPFYNCLTLPRPKDTLLDEGGILDTARTLAKALKNQAGVGFRIDSLRPKGTPLKSSVGVASGPVSFMKLFDAVTGIIVQGGSRKGALLIAMSARHPDILEFIKYKKSESTALSNMNISVLCDNDFMESVKNGMNIFQTFTETSVPARPIWKALCKNAWESGDPGIIYEDTMQDAFVEIKGHPFELTNACSEIPLPSYGVCLLGSINLMQHVTPDGLIDYKKLSETTDLAVRFLDRIIDLGGYPLPECEEVQKATRRIGIGVMGLAHALIHCGVCYDDANGIYVAERVFKTITQQAEITSNVLAYNHGGYITPMWRNAALVAGPPTGTTSELAGVSPGIEPVFFDEMIRRDGMGEGYKVVDPMFALGKEKFGDKLPDYYQIAHDISPENRVAMQAVIQKHVDNAVSSTVNLPATATVDDVASVFMQAWETKCKSITVYRQGSRSNAPIQEVKPIAKAEIDVGEPKGILTDLQDILDHPLNQLADKASALRKLLFDRRWLEDLTSRKEELHKILDSCPTYLTESSPIVDVPIQEVKPEEITPQDSLKAFNQIWEEDLGKQEDLTKHHEEIPFELDAKRYRVPYHINDKLYITISHKDGKPFEIFLYSKKAEHIAWCNALTILISSFLQDRLTLDLIIDKLKGIIEPGGGAFTKIGEKGCRVNSGPAALGLVLEYFLESQKSPSSSEDLDLSFKGAPDVPEDLELIFKGEPGEHIYGVHGSGEICPECSQPYLIPSEGCMTCAACGYSKC